MFPPTDPLDPRDRWYNETDRRVFRLLAAWAGLDQKVQACTIDLAAETGLSVRTVQRSLKKLEEADVIWTVPGGWLLVWSPDARRLADDAADAGDIEEGPGDAP